MLNVTDQSSCLDSFSEAKLNALTRFREPLAELKRAVGLYLSKNARNFVDLEGLFSTLSLLNVKQRIAVAATA